MKKRKRTKIKSKKEITMEKQLMIYGLSNGFEDLSKAILEANIFLLITII